MSFYKYFKALPFKRLTSDTLRKVTRKRQDVDIANSEYYPCEGHTSVKLDDGNFIFFGGAAKDNESRWATANNIFKVTFVSESNDVNISEIL